MPCSIVLTAFELFLTAFELEYCLSFIQSSWLWEFGVGWTSGDRGVRLSLVHGALAPPLILFSPKGLLSNISRGRLTRGLASTTASSPSFVPVPVLCCYTSSQTVRTVRDGEPRTSTSSFTQLPSSVVTRRIYIADQVERSLGEVAKADSRLACHQHTRELISARKTSHKHNNKDLSRLR